MCELPLYSRNVDCEILATPTKTTKTLNRFSLLVFLQEAGVLSKIKKTKVVGLRESAAVVYRIGGISGFFQVHFTI